MFLYCFRGSKSEVPGEDDVLISCTVHVDKKQISGAIHAAGHFRKCRKYPLRYLDRVPVSLAFYRQKVDIK